MNKPPVDLDDALPRVDGDLGFLAALLEMFKEDFEERAAKIAGALERGDLVSVSDLAHAIKGASANLGLPFVRQSALDLENAARSGDIEGAAASRESLDREFRRVVEFLKTHPLT